MLSVVRNESLQEVKKLRSSSRDIDVLRTVVSKLAAGEELPESFRDHALGGSYRDYRECHLASDWLLIYQRREDTLILVRTGSHSELFG
jgi:mRNA interferase YafQ